MITPTHTKHRITLMKFFRKNWKSLLLAVGGCATYLVAGDWVNGVMCILNECQATM